MHFPNYNYHLQLYDNNIRRLINHFFTIIFKLVSNLYKDPILLKSFTSSDNFHLVFIILFNTFPLYFFLEDIYTYILYYSISTLTIISPSRFARKDLLRAAIFNHRLPGFLHFKNHDSRHLGSAILKSSYLA